MRQLALLLALFVLAVPGCGGDDDDSGSGDGSGGGDAAQPASDEEAVRQAVITYQSSSDCDALTDRFLEEQVVFSDADTRDELCEAYEEEGQIGNVDEDEVQISEVKVTGDTATAEQTAPGTSTYELVKEDGRWRIDSAEF